MLIVDVIKDHFVLPSCEKELAKKEQMLPPCIIRNSCSIAMKFQILLFIIVPKSPARLFLVFKRVFGTGRTQVIEDCHEYKLFGYPESAGVD